MLTNPFENEKRIKLINLKVSDSMKLSLFNSNLAMKIVENRQPILTIASMYTARGLRVIMPPAFLPNVSNKLNVKITI